MNVIELNNITMKFNMSKDRIEGIKEYFIKLLKRQLLYNEFIALSDISFNVEKGEVLGLLGLNGAGKSTLLKIICGILKPTSGTVSIHGSISPLIELGSGFDRNLTARENVYLYGYILGYTKKYIDSKFDEIIEFAELGDFVDVSIKNFSSGMTARLGFAVATMVRPDILIVDEILSVGDFKFRQKCEKRLSEMMSGGTTVIIVSHSLSQIERLCSKVVWLEGGKIKMMGSTQEICEAYKNQ